MEEGWHPLVQNSSGNKPTDEFALLIEEVPKFVFSDTLKTVNWKNTTLATSELRKEVIYLTESSDKTSLGSPNLIISLLKLDLIDEYRFCVQPIILGKGLPLFRRISEPVKLKLIESKSFKSGAIMLTYSRQK